MKFIRISSRRAHYCGENMDNDYLEIECEFIANKEEFIIVNDGDRNIFIPKNVIDDFDFKKVRKGEFIIFSVKEWFIIEEELDPCVI